MAVTITLPIGLGVGPGLPVSAVSLAGHTPSPTDYWLVYCAIDSSITQILMRERIDNPNIAFNLAMMVPGNSISTAPNAIASPLSAAYILVQYWSTTALIDSGQRSCVWDPLSGLGYQSNAIAALASSGLTPAQAAMLEDIYNAVIRTYPSA